jgi:hypothetical protein
MAKQILVETVDGVTRTWWDVRGKEYAVTANGDLLDSYGPIAKLDGAMQPCSGPSVHAPEAIHVAAEIRAALDDRDDGGLRATHIETKTFTMEHHWYNVGGQKYAVACEDGQRGRLIDSEGTVLAVLDGQGYVIHPSQLRYNAIFCDPAARQRARDRFEAIAAAIREFDEAYFAQHFAEAARLNAEFEARNAKETDHDAT